MSSRTNVSSFVIKKLITLAPIQVPNSRSLYKIVHELSKVPEPADTYGRYVSDEALIAVVTIATYKLDTTTRQRWRAFIADGNSYYMPAYTLNAMKLFLHGEIEFYRMYELGWYMEPMICGQCGRFYREFDVDFVFPEYVPQRIVAAATASVPRRQSI